MGDLPTILVIEDDGAIQGIVEEALNDGGLKPAIAATGEEAISLLMGKQIEYRALVTTSICQVDLMAGKSLAPRARSTRNSGRLHDRRCPPTNGDQRAFPTASF